MVPDGSPLGWRENWISCGFSMREKRKVNIPGGCSFAVGGNFRAPMSQLVIGLCPVWACIPAEVTASHGWSFHLLRIFNMMHLCHRALNLI